MEIVAFISGGAVALAGKAVYDTVLGPNSVPLAPPIPPPLPPTLLNSAPTLKSFSRARAPKVRMFVPKIMPCLIEDLTVSYLGQGRVDKRPLDCLLSIAAPAQNAANTQAYVKDPNLINKSRLKHVEISRPKPQPFKPNEDKLCELFELGKIRLKKTTTIL